MLVVGRRGEFPVTLGESASARFEGESSFEALRSEEECYFGSG